MAAVSVECTVMLKESSVDFPPLIKKQVPRLCFFFFFFFYKRVLVNMEGLLAECSRVSGQ